jgi:gliding motility-associated-like protein
MKILLIILSVFVFTTAKSQNNSLLPPMAAPKFIKVYGDAKRDVAYGVTAVGNYYIYVGKNDNVPIMTQVDLNGNLVTSKKFDEYGEITNVYATNDGNVIFNLNHVENSSDDEFQLIKYNPNTQSVIWRKGYDLPGRFFSVVMSKNAKDEIFVSHWHDPTLSSDDSYHIIKLDANGNIIWSKAIKNGDTQFYAITSLNDGGCIVAGESINSSRKSNVVRLDANGNIVFFREYDWWNDQTVFYMVTVLGDGNLLAAGQNLTLQKPIMAKLNINNGNIIWTERRENLNSRYSFYSDHDRFGNTYVRVDDLNGGATWGIDKLDKTGNWLWGKRISNAAGGTSIATTKTSPEALVITNYVDSVFGKSDVQLLVSDLDMNTSCTVFTGSQGYSNPNLMIVTTPNFTIDTITYNLETPSYIQPISLCEAKSCGTNMSKNIEIDVKASLCQGACFTFRNQKFCSSADLIKTSSCGYDTIYHIKLKFDALTAKSVNLASCSDALGNTCFDLNSVKDSINNDTATLVGFYLDAACTQPVASPFCTNGSISMIYARAVKDSCSAIAPLKLKVSKLNKTTQNITRCEGESFIYKNQVFTNTTFFEDKLTAKNGCDSIHQLNIIFEPIVKKEIIVNRCNDSVYVFAGQALNKAGIYTDVKKGKNTCDSITTLYLSFESCAIKIDSLKIKNNLCFGEEKGAINISLSGAIKPYSIDYQNIATKMIYKNGDKLPSGTYFITIKDSGLGAKQLKKDTTITISEPPKVYVNIGVSQTISLGDSIFLDVKTNAPNLLWTNALPCSNCQQVWAAPKSSTLYSIKASNNNGCTEKDSIKITVINDVNIYIPNSFSPNDDGKNDIFTAFGKDGFFQIKLMRIFDRWGTLLYENANFLPNAINQSGWDGTYKKQPALQSVYTYYIVVKFINDEEKVFKGDVTLFGH